MELSERKKQILRAVVENYIQTAEPVGSKAIVASAGLKVSSATIRNEMAELENLGYLEQPHTSAGRIPSPKGYRLYVNELMEEHRLTMQEAEKINEALNLKIREMDQVMSEANATTDDADRTALYLQAEKILTEQAANVYLQDLADMVAIHKNLTGFQFYPLYVLDLSGISWAQ